MSEPIDFEQHDRLDAEFADLRRLMVDRQLRRRDITDERVLAAMNAVPRHEFVSDATLRLAYSDQALPLDHGQTISQPYIAALMSQLARTTPESVALDVGTGSGYQAAVLSKLCRHVYSIEIVAALADSARERLRRLDCANVEVCHGDGYGGSREHAPFDCVIVAAAAPEVPQPLVDQLKPGARLIIPIGDSTSQHLQVVEEQHDGTTQRWSVAPVAFVPMTGEARG